MKPLEIKCGDRFGRLVVIGDPVYRGQHNWVLAECDCGNRLEVRVASLNCGNTVSCGCRWKEINLLKKYTTTARGPNEPEHLASVLHQTIAQ